jgi:hypothetical protein
LNCGSELRIEVRGGAVVILLSWIWCSSAVAVDYRAERLDQPAPADEIPAEIAQQLAPQGVSVIRGTSRVLCEIWPCRQWTVEQFEPPADLKFPLKPGQLVGLIRFRSKGGDIRDQDIDTGMYTLRYAAQPVDGDHTGTSPTRDFLALLPIEQDQTAAIVDYKTMVKHSAAAAKSSHPAVLSLQAADGDGPIRHDEQAEWWLVRLSGQLQKGQETQPLAMDLVIVGTAAE